MEGGLLSSEELKAFAKDYVRFAHVTTKIDGRAHDDLMERKGGTGFPYVATMNADGRVIATLGLGGRDLAGLEAMMKAGAAYEAKRAKADRTDAETAELLAFDVGVGNVTPEEARKTLASLDLDEDAADELDMAIADVEIAAVLATIRSRDDLPVVGEKLAAMMSEGKIPTDAGRAVRFYAAIIAYAERARDLPAFEKALAALARRAERDGGARRIVEQKQPVLDALKAEAEK